MDQPSRPDAQTGADATGSTDLLEREDLLALVDSSGSLAREVRLTRLLRSILQDATRLTDSPDGSVILHDEARSRLYFADAVGANAPMLLEKWGKQSAQGVPLVGSKAGQAFTSHTSQVVDAVAEDPNHLEGVDRETRRRTASMVCVPLIVTSRRSGERRALGVIQILNKRQGNYTPRDRLLLERFADQAAVALENAQLVSDLFAHMGLYATDDMDPLQAYNDLRSRPAWQEALSVLFADMRGFTQFCQVVGRPDEAQRKLNEFLTLLAEAVVAHGGLVNKFLGDGLLALFRSDDHARRAVDCGFAMLKAFDALKRRWDEQSNVRLTFLDLGIGISTEDVTLGSVGSERIWEFTAVGTGVNLAAYLMENARNGRRLLVDRVTFRSAQDLVDQHEGPEQFELRKPGQTVAHPYERYTLVRRKGDDGPGDEPAEDAPASGTGTVFISYSHEDAHWLALLQKHLKPYVRGGAADVWDDTKIRAGDEWRASIDQALERAQVALLLVTPNFLFSDFVARNELPPLLDKARARGVRILWVPVTASSYEETPIGAFQAAMNPATPLDTMPEAEQHQALVSVCKLVKGAL